MEPYFQDEWVTLYHGDCVELADAWLGAEVLVTDPPYGVAYKSNFGKCKKHDRIAGDQDSGVRDRVLAMWGDSRPALVFGSWRVQRPAGVRQVGIWDKGDSPGMGDLTIPWGNSFEEFYIIGGGFSGKRGGAVLRVNTPPPSNRPNHPTPKPVALMEALIEKCPPGVIADPFAGSGSTLLAARNLGRKVIGVELEEKYCEVIVKRLSQQAFDFSALESA